MVDAPPLTEALANLVPDTLVTAHGDDIEIQVWDEDMGSPPDDSKPTVKIGLLSGAPVDQLMPHEDPPIVNVDESESFVFSSDQDIYQVEERDIATVERVSAIVSGTRTVLTQGEDYEVYSTEEYSSFDAIRFLDNDRDVASFGTEVFGTETFGTGGSKHGSVDDGTRVDIDYTHKMIQPRDRSTWNLIWRIASRAPRLDDGELGATREYRNPARLGNQLHDSLVKELAAKEGANLWSIEDGAPQPGAYVLHEIRNIGRLPVTDDNTVIDRFIDVRTSRIGITEQEKVRLAGRTDTEANVIDQRGQVP